tara:strand:+ start:163 stop:582 length:420 start_codon:yes stop_codon:yes gene_type:complete
MAHFAKIGLDNIVEAVVVLRNIDTMTEGGIEQEAIGVAKLEKDTGHSTWKKCSCNTRANVHQLGGTPFRANFPSVGWKYDSTNDIFTEPRPTDKDGDPCTSWTLNTTTGRYDPPSAAPSYQHIWDESASAWVDNSAAYS